MHLGLILFLFLPSWPLPVASLQGRFLHITDFHPDLFYKSHTSTDDDDSVCHRGKGPAGYYGAETSDCDSPISLVNETFKWIAENIRDQIDFVVWTGDSARHDSDERIPRTAVDAIKTNHLIATKFAETFGNGVHPDDPKYHVSIPVIPSFGNNDFLPHNIFYPGPNSWLYTYLNLWGKFIPEEQRHGFERGGWFYVETIPNKLAVFSLNTMYFFTHNAAVDGCSATSEPGFEHMEWLRIHLQFLRERGMKAILTGHVPPARTESKQLWDETCWQKYTLYLQQYRDVVIAGLFGHMNIDHFMLQDTKDIDLLQNQPATTRSQMDKEFTINSATDYLQEIREMWSELPKMPHIWEQQFYDNEKDAVWNQDDFGNQSKKTKKPKKDKNFEKIGGLWGERFQVTYVSPSIVPNYYPTLRVFEYNMTGLERSTSWNQHSIQESTDYREEWEIEDFVPSSDDTPSAIDEQHVIGNVDYGSSEPQQKRGRKKKKKKPKNPDSIIVPPSPVKGSPPGPAYFPQTLTLLGYTQYFANITRINAAVPDHAGLSPNHRRSDKHKKNPPKEKSPPEKFKFEIEYDTFSDKTYRLKDLTVPSYLRLAYRMGRYKPEKGDSVMFEASDESSPSPDAAKAPDAPDLEGEEVTESGKKVKKDKHKKKKKKKKKKQRERNKAWLAFVQRAFVGTRDAENVFSVASRGARSEWGHADDDDDDAGEL